jgi:beta-glucosidase
MIAASTLGRRWIRTRLPAIAPLIPPHLLEVPMKRLRCLPAVWLIASVALLCGRAAAKDTKDFASTKPVPKNDAWWQARHKSMNERIKKGNVDLLMIGDSITHGWEGAGKVVWKQYYDKRNAVNLGIGGDQTQHVLWRLENGNIDGIQPKLAVLMIGTNNAGCGNPAEIAAGVTAIVTKLRAKLPQTKVLVLAIFPRGADPKDHLRQVNAKTNEIIAKLADGKDVYFLDIGDKFLDKDGNLPREIMPDRLHPNPKGYAIWAEAIEPTVKKLMGEK